METRRILLVAGALLAAAAALVMLLGRPPQGRRSAPGLSSPTAAGHPRTADDPGGSHASAAYDGGPIQNTLADRRIRDELRRRIIAAWATEGEGDLAAAARDGRLAPMPPDPDGGLVDPAYIQSVIREDMFPMAKACYEELLARQPDAGGRVELFFKIVADDQLGGIVDEVSLDGGAADAIRDEKMETCLRESLLSLAFRPPPKDGWVTIGYPLVFAP